MTGAAHQRSFLDKKPFAISKLIFNHDCAFNTTNTIHIKENDTDNIAERNIISHNLMKNQLGMQKLGF
jgi:hypothetical protein